MPTSWQRSMGIPLFTPLMIRQLPPDRGTIAMEILKELPLVDVYFCTHWRRRTGNWGFHFSEAVKSQYQSHWCGACASQLYAGLPLKWRGYDASPMSIPLQMVGSETPL